MKFLTAVLPCLALASAFVVPDEKVMKAIQIESERTPEVWDEGFLPQELRSHVEEFMSEIEDTLLNVVDEVQEGLKSHQGFRGCDKTVEDLDEPHHPHHPHKPHKPEKSIYELINDNKYTTKFAELVEEFDDIKELLMGMDANYTLFVPSDKAFERIPEHGHKPSKEILKKVLKYHIVDGFYPAGRVFASHTLPSMLEGTNLSDSPEKTPQRLNVKFGLGGLAINGYSRVRYPNVFATNGVIHGVDHILIPPPSIATFLDFVPQYFSTLDLALVKTGLDKLKNATHLGATVFAPTNRAFAGLGVKANAFLFSKYGLKYLKALVKYHIVPNKTFYSDKYYVASKESSAAVPKSRYHADLPTLLKDQILEIDVARYGALIEMKINAFSRVSYQDVVAKDGVIQIPSRVLIPPKRYKDDESVHYEGGEISVDELKEHLDPYIGGDSDQANEDEAEDAQWNAEL